MIININFDESIFERDGGLRYRWTGVENIRKRIDVAQRQQRELTEKRERLDAEHFAALEKYNAEIPLAVKRDERRAAAYVNRLEKEIKQLQKENKEQVSADTSSKVHPTDLQRARTIAIFDGILFAIENWSTDGQTAPDFTMICQSVLFPVVYEKVMDADHDYYLGTVPASAVEVVKRGREYIKHFRETITESLTTEKSWDVSCEEIHRWCLNDMLPLLYGARDDDWDASHAYSLAQMLQWRDMPQSRLLDFPKIQDAMDLVNEHGDIIRESTGLPDLTKQTVLTRIEP